MRSSFISKIPHRTFLVVFVDLDGTIVVPQINNTYQFIKLFAKVKRDTLRYLLYSFVLMAMPFISTIYWLSRKVLGLSKNIVSLDALMITLLFAGVNVRSLREFSIKWVHSLVRLRLINKKVLKLIKYFKRNKAKLILLTACTELPACVIAKYLGFDICLARRFLIKWDIILGVRDADDIPLLKLKKIARLRNLLPIKEVYTIYVVDKSSASIEHEILRAELFDHVIIV